MDMGNCLLTLGISGVLRPGVRTARGSVEVSRIQPSEVSRSLAVPLSAFRDTALAPCAGGAGEELGGGQLLRHRCRGAAKRGAAAGRDQSVRAAGPDLTRTSADSAALTCSSASLRTKLTQSSSSAESAGIGSAKSSFNSPAARGNCRRTWRPGCQARRACSAAARLPLRAPACRGTTRDRMRLAALTRR